jgi:hypothetical protein
MILWVAKHKGREGAKLEVQSTADRSIVANGRARCIVDPLLCSPRVRYQAAALWLL